MDTIVDITIESKNDQIHQCPDRIHAKMWV